jgi:hypothetical protein
MTVALDKLRKGSLIHDSIRWNWYKHYFLKPLVRAMRHMNDRELKLSIIIGIVLFLAGLLDLLYSSAV